MNKTMIINAELKRIQDKKIKLDKTIELLKNYNNTTLAEKIYLAQNTNIYFEREKFSEDIRKCFKSDLLRNSEVTIILNNICIHTEKRIIKIPKCYSKSIVFKYKSDDVISEYSKQPYISNSELINKINKLKNKLDELENELIDLSIFNIFKKIEITEKIDKLRSEIDFVKSDVKFNDIKNSQIKDHNDYIDKLIDEDKKFLELIKEDIEYFKDNGFEFLFYIAHSNYWSKGNN